jgi:RimJ/RimL family protein N-acetyltransferase
LEDAVFAGLETDGLVIRRFQPSDAEPFSAYRNDPDVARHQGWELPYTARDAADFIASLTHLSPGRPGTWFQFAVAPAQSGALIGDVALRTTFEDPSQGEIGFSFAVASQGRGYAEKAVRSVIKYAFTTLGMRRVFAITDSRNTRAQNLLLRLGFQLEQKINDGALLYSQLDAHCSTEHAV